MDSKEEYHDPDYAGTSETVKEEPPSLSEDERIEKIKKIIRREFSNELDVRENEVMLIDQRMTTSRRILHRLRYTLVSNYYSEQKLQLGSEQVRDEIARSEGDVSQTEMSTLLSSGQRRLHPSVRKLLGRRSVDLSEIFKTRQPRSKPRPDYSAMLQTRNYTIAADSTKSLRPDRGDSQTASASDGSSRADRTPADRPKKLPRHIEPRVDKVLTLDEQTRNKVKHRYRIVIGNTSKYAPPASLADRSTHKWLLYVRHYSPPGADPLPEGEGVIKGVTARLHHSYAPHHTVTLHKPPFHISRRGWGEFTARIELQFALPHLNPPAHVAHTLKLDRHYTGLQTLGAETIVDVWLYSSPEMLKYAYVEDTNTQTDTQANTQADTQADKQASVVKEEPMESTADDSWMEFFTHNTRELDVDEMIIKPVKSEPPTDIHMDADEVETQVKAEPVDFEEQLVPSQIRNQTTSPKKRIMKYIDPTTGKIYYLEMDRNLDLSTVQEIVINNDVKTSPVKNGVNVKKKLSLSKPEVKKVKTEIDPCLRHIENDHCYLGSVQNFKKDSHISAVEKSVKECSDLMLFLRKSLSRLSDVRTCVYFLLKNIPLVDSRALNPEYQRRFPFAVDSEERYWKLDFAKRRNIEWSRAKMITRLLSERPQLAANVWRTKQVLTFARLHGFHIVRPEPTIPTHDDWSSWKDLDSKTDSDMKEFYKTSDINTLSVFKSDFNTEVTVDLVDSDEEVDIVSDVSVDKKVVLSDNCEGLEPLPQSEEERLRFLFVERVCADIGIELRNEDVGNGYCHSAVHAVLLSALKSFSEEMVRSSLAAARLCGEPVPAVWTGWSSSRGVVNLSHVYQAAGGVASGGLASDGQSGGHSGGHSGTVAGRLRFLSAASLGTHRKNTSAL